MFKKAFLTATLIATAPQSYVSAQQVFRIDVHGTIEMGLAPHVKRGIAEAEASGAEAILLNVNTPGGRVDAALQIVAAVTATEVPVYALVDPMAWSAGALISLAADSIFMSPASSIGAATPVDGAGTRAPEKIVSAMRAEFRTLAELRGLDPRIAEAMVDETIAIDGIIAGNRLLVLTAGEAVNVGFAAAQYESEAELLATLGLADAEVVAVRINWAEKLVRFLSNPAVAPLLLSIGMLAIIIEIKTSAFGIAGIIGLTSLGAFFGSHLLIGLAGWEELILLGIGVVALLIEVFLIPGLGIAGGIAVLSIGSAVFLSMLGNLPTVGDVAQAGGILLAATVVVIAGVYAMVRTMPTSSRFRGLFLGASTAKENGYVAAQPRDDLVGLDGLATTDLRPAGTAMIDGERLDVVTEGDFISKGQRVQVVRSDGYRHIVDLVDRFKLNEKG